MISRNKIKEAFDKALKQRKGGNLQDVYITDDGNPYEAYCTNEQWLEFIEDMQKKHKKAYDEFKKGNGGELDEKPSESGRMMPPKMASYASSSRFIYEKSKHLGDSFEFECKLPIAFKGFVKEAEASLDGYVPSKRLFIEAKCHEFYPNHYTEFKRSYKKFYDYLNEQTRGLFSYDVVPGENKQNILFKWAGEELQSLDLKQLLCHMLGIAKKALQDDCSEVSTLLYLVYKPDEEMLKYVPTEEEKNGIIDCWNMEKEEAEEVDFPLLYRHIVRYIHDERKNWQKEKKYSDRVDEIAKAFKFRFCDQNEYKKIISSVK